jgi:hypothetical protein
MIPSGCLSRVAEIRVKIPLICSRSEQWTRISKLFALDNDSELAEED